MSAIIAKKKELTHDQVEARVKRALNVIGKEIYLPSHFIAKELLGVAHKSLLRKIRKEIDNLAAQNGAAKLFKESSYTHRGKTEKNYLLSEQATMIIMMSYNNKTASLYRYYLSEIFYAMKEVIIKNRLTVEFNKRDEEWLKIAANEKQARLTLTDAINKYLIPQRMAEGKTGDGWQYKSYTKLSYKIFGAENTDCVIIKDLFTKKQRQDFEALEYEIAALIEKYAKEGLHYKEIYKKIRDDLSGG